MKKIIVALMLSCFAVPAFADKPAPRPPVFHKKKHKKVYCILPPTALPPVVAPPVVPVAPPVVVVVPPTPVVVVAPPVVVPLCVVGCPPEGVVNTSLHLAVGVGAQNPWVSGLAGVRVEFPKVYLGLEPFVSVPYGVGLDGMVYAYRGKVVQFYPLSVGFMLNFNYNKDPVFGKTKFLSDQDVNRVVDLRLGAGLQIKLACKIKLAIDWRVSIPDPVKLANNNGICRECATNGARALDAGTATKNAFAQSQVLVGILFN